MKVIVRTLLKQLEADLFTGKALIIMGPRQSGKTTLVRELMAKHQDKRCLYLDADDILIRKQLTNPSTAQLRNIISDHDIVVIDEAQRVENIGLTLKIIVDQIKSTQVIATGSSSFDLANLINEPLTGRKCEYTLFPLSHAEMVQHTSYIEERQMLEQRVIYGFYPEVVCQAANPERALREIANSYLFKDIFTLEKINRPTILENLVKALALQVSREVSYNELAQLVGVDKNTVAKYLDLLEKAWIVFKLPALHRNVRNEIKRGKKYYFWDNGILNTILGNFNILNMRTDTGALWENFIVSERLKAIRNAQIYRSYYFWRTTMQQEIDLIEESGAKFSAYEIKFNPRKKPQISKTFSSAYPVQSYNLVSPENYHEFLINPDLDSDPATQ